MARKPFPAQMVYASVPFLMRTLLNNVGLMSKQFGVSRFVQYAIMKLAQDIIDNPHDLLRTVNKWNSLRDKDGVGWEHHLPKALKLIYDESSRLDMLTVENRVEHAGRRDTDDGPDPNDDTGRKRPDEAGPEAG